MKKIDIFPNYVLIYRKWIYHVYFKYRLCLKNWYRFGQCDNLEIEAVMEWQWF